MLTQSCPQPHGSTGRSLRRSIGIFALILVALAVLAVACSGKSEPPDGARLALDGDTFDLGLIGLDETVERAVEFRNEGNEPLTVSIVKIRPSPNADCGCGVEGSEVQPEVVEPGASGQLVFRLFVPPGMEGYRDEMFVELASNDPANSERTITIIFQMEAKPDSEG